MYMLYVFLYTAPALHTIVNLDRGKATQPSCVESLYILYTHLSQWDDLAPFVVIV